MSLSFFSVFNYAFHKKSLTFPQEKNTWKEVEVEEIVEHWAVNCEVSMWSVEVERVLCAQVIVCMKLVTGAGQQWQTTIAAALQCSKPILPGRLLKLSVSDVTSFVIFVCPKQARVKNNFEAMWGVLSGVLSESDDISVVYSNCNIVVYQIHMKYKRQKQHRKAWNIVICSKIV